MADGKENFEITAEQLKRLKDANTSLEERQKILKQIKAEQKEISSYTQNELADLAKMSRLNA